MTFKDLNALVSRRQPELADIGARAKDTVYGSVSPFWKGLLNERPNFLGAERFNDFRNATTSAMFGIGDHKDQGEMKALFDQSLVDTIGAQNIPDEVIAKISEPLLGSPETIPYRGNLLSTHFLNNIASAWRISNFVKRLVPGGRPVRICEIGAGYGATAFLLHQFLDVSSYTIIDLPENLYLSSIFLPMSLPGRSHQLIDPALPQTFNCSAELNFSLPSFTDSLHAPAFDLVLNRASLGEMPMATAKAYIAWIKTRLAPDGIFYSSNRFNVAKAGGMTRLSDYGFQGFRVRSHEALERPNKPHFQIHSEVVVSLGAPNITDAAAWDVIGDLTACGFDTEIADVVKGIVAGTTRPEVSQALRILSVAFSPSSAQAKHTILQNPALNVLGPVAPVLLSIVELIGGAIDAAESRKQSVLALNLGLKIDVRLRGLYAEREAQAGRPWLETLLPLKQKSHSLWRMSEMLMEEKKTPFSYAFRRDLRLTA